ncbi:hypothetical protein CH063_03826, partial [Colletotrichum higginsianum]
QKSQLTYCHIVVPHRIRSFVRSSTGWSQLFFSARPPFISTLIIPPTLFPIPRSQLRHWLDSVAAAAAAAAIASFSSHRPNSAVLISSHLTLANLALHQLQLRIPYLILWVQTSVSLFPLARPQLKRQQQQQVFHGPSTSKHQAIQTALTAQSHNQGLAHIRILLSTSLGSHNLYINTTFPISSPCRPSNRESVPGSVIQFTSKVPRYGTQAR